MKQANRWIHRRPYPAVVRGLIGGFLVLVVWGLVQPQVDFSYLSACVAWMAVFVAWVVAASRRSEDDLLPVLSRRPAIPERIRNQVWRRDLGRCVDCGSRERLEYDHIIPFSRGGSNTARNLELRCEACNRRKGARI